MRSPTGASATATRPRAAGASLSSPGRTYGSAAPPSFASWCAPSAALASSAATWRTASSVFAWTSFAFGAKNAGRSRNRSRRFSSSAS